MYCLTCHAQLEPGDRRCWHCGRKTRPLLYPGAVYAIVVAVLALVLYVGVNRLWSAAREHGRAAAAPRTSVAQTTVAPTTAPPTSTGTTVAPTPQPVKATGIDVSSQTGSATNGCGQATSYDAANLQDGDPSTAWRVKGDGTGQTIRLALAGPTHLTSVGLLPGYAKVDNCTSADRFKQMRKVASVSWTFDGGAKVAQSFQPTPQIQTEAVDVVTTSVTIEITATTPGDGSLDYTPISEIALLGTPVG
jgi:hypothetical protein